VTFIMFSIIQGVYIRRLEINGLASGMPDKRPLKAPVNAESKEDDFEVVKFQ